MQYFQHIIIIIMTLSILILVLTFGFDPIVYSMWERVGSVDLGVFFISGNAGHFVPHVNASAFHGTATGKITSLTYYCIGCHCTPIHRQC